MVPEIELVRILLKISDISFRTYKVLYIGRKSKVRECGEILRGNKLAKLALSVEESARGESKEYRAKESIPPHLARLDIGRFLQFRPFPRRALLQWARYLGNCGLSKGA